MAAIILNSETTCEPNFVARCVGLIRASIPAQATLWRSPAETQFCCRALRPPTTNGARRATRTYAHCRTCGLAASFATSPKMA